jgi:hypothetical protein
MAVSFIGGGNQSNHRKPTTCHKSLTNFLSHNVVSSTSHFKIIAKQIKEHFIFETEAILDRVSEYTLLIVK